MLLLESKHFEKTSTLYTGVVTAAQPVPHDVPSCDEALARAFEFLGRRWNGMLLGTLASGPASFSEIRRAVGGISDSVLSERLTQLTRAELIVREVDEGPPVGVRYRLAPAGEALMPMLAGLTTWAREHLTVSQCAEHTSP